MEAGINDGFFFRERFLQIRFDPRHCSRRYDPIAKNKGGRIVVPFALNAKRKKKKRKNREKHGGQCIFDRQRDNLFDREFCEATTGKWIDQGSQGMWADFDRWQSRN